MILTGRVFLPDVECLCYDRVVGAKIEQLKQLDLQDSGSGAILARDWPCADDLYGTRGIACRCEGDRQTVAMRDDGITQRRSPR